MNVWIKLQLCITLSQIYDVKSVAETSFDSRPAGYSSQSVCLFEYLSINSLLTLKLSVQNVFSVLHQNSKLYFLISVAVIKVNLQPGLEKWQQYTWHYSCYSVEITCFELYCYLICVVLFTKTNSVCPSMTIVSCMKTIWDNSAFFYCTLFRAY